jgi:hypothetical protein
MQDSSSFKQEFVARLLHIARSGAFGLTAGAAACGGQAEKTREVQASAGGASASGGASGTAGASAAGGSAGSSATGGSGGSGGSLIVIDASAGRAGFGGIPAQCDAAVPPDGGEVLDAAADAWRGELVCIGRPGRPDADCLSACEAYPERRCIGISRRVTGVLGGPYPAPGACCYDVLTESYPCYVGRTFFIDEGVVTAELRPGKSWSDGPAPRVAELDARTRRALGEAWARDGLFEHASVASFARFVMQLLALGAPASLVRDAHAAAIDEVAHAEISLALAAGYFGESVEPTPLPFGAPLAIEADLPSVAAETVMEGCIGETVATLQALAALEHTTDPAVREVLVRTVLDEARHAELAWRFMAWALGVGGTATHVAIARAFEAFKPPPARNEDLSGVDLAAYAGHGRQTAPDARAIAERVLADVVRPLAAALLATSPWMTPCATAA